METRPAPLVLPEKPPQSRDLAQTTAYLVSLGSFWEWGEPRPSLTHSLLLPFVPVRPPWLSLLWFWGSPSNQHPPPAQPRGPYLLLAQHQDPLRLDGVVGGQVLAVAALGAVLVGLPDPVAGGPGDADMVPLAVIDHEGQLGHLGGREDRQGVMCSGAQRRAAVVTTRRVTMTLPITTFKTGNQERL